MELQSFTGKHILRSDLQLTEVKEKACKSTLYCLLWEVNFAANTCITLNTLQVSFILLVVKSMFKGDIFKNLPGFCFTEKHDWAMKE